MESGDEEDMREMDWGKMHEDMHKNGFREGFEKGKDEGLQKFFEEGYKISFENAFKFGQLHGKIESKILKNPSMKEKDQLELIKNDIIEKEKNIQTILQNRITSKELLNEFKDKIDKDYENINQQFIKACATNP